SAVFLSIHHPATPRTSPLSLHDALPICRGAAARAARPRARPHSKSVRLVLGLDSRCPHREALTCRLPPLTHWSLSCATAPRRSADRKSTRLNSSHLGISYAVFCLKKKTE